MTDSQHAEVLSAVATTGSEPPPVDPMARRNGVAGAGAVLRVLRFCYPLAVCCAIWEIVAVAHIVSPLLFPTLSQVVSALWKGLIAGTSMWPDVGVTLRRAALGFIIAVVVGVAAGLGMSASRWLREFLDPLISITFPTPKLALFPLFLVWFGIGDTTKVILVAFGAVFPVIVNTYTGSTSVPRYLIWNARSKGASRLQIIFHVVLPASMPQIFAGIRIASSLAFLLAVSAELISSTSGLGFLILSSEQSFAPAQTVAAIVLTGVLGLILDRIIYALQRFTLRWQENVGA